MNLVVAVDSNWGIGYKNNLLCSLKQDMQFFRRTTMNKTVIMGRKTLESFPGSKPLKNRNNIVLSNTSQHIEGATVVSSISQLKQALGGKDLSDVFVIGGQQIYSLLLDYCEYAYITKIDSEFKADSYFPNLDEMDNWRIDSEIMTICQDEIHAQVLKYINHSFKPL